MEADFGNTSKRLLNNGSGDITIEDITQEKHNKKIRDLNAYLKSHVSFITEKNSRATNVIDLYNKKTYHIPPAELEEFLTLLEDCRKDECNIHYAECQTDVSGIILDFNRIQDSKTRQIENKHITRLLTVVSQILEEVLDIRHNIIHDEFKYHAFVLQQPDIIFLDSGRYKDGFHIIIPEIMISREVKKYIITEILQRKIMTKIFSDIGNVESPEDMLDHQSASNPVMFFGNSKIGKQAYGLFAVYDIVIDNVLRSYSVNRAEVPAKCNLIYELSLNFYNAAHSTWLTKCAYTHKPELSISTQVEQIQDNNENDLIELLENNLDAAFINKVLDLLDSAYTTDNEKRFAVIRALANTSVDYKPLAAKFSHDQDELDRIWDSESNKYDQVITSRSIMFWAKECSPQKYKELNDIKYFKKLQAFAYDHEGEIEHAMVAYILQMMLSDKFIVDVASIDGSSKYCWYEFVTPGQNHIKGELFKWRQEVQPDTIQRYISEYLPDVYSKIANEFRDKREKAIDKHIIKYWAKIEKSFKRSTTKLFNDTYKNGIIKQACYKFRQRGFVAELDSDPDIIGVGNGVLKLDKSPYLIHGFHEYKISKFTDVDYIPYNPENPWVRLLENAFHDILPEKDVYEFVMFYLSICLDGHNAAPMILFLVGAGNNGKSFITKCLEVTLGSKYAYVAPHTLITAPIEKASGPNSAYFSCKGKRAIIYTEPEKNEKLYTSRLKSMTSPDTQTTRALFKDQDNFTIIGNQILDTNHDLTTDCTDHGLWKRIRYYKCKVKFSLKPNSNNPYEKLEDRRFTDVYIHEREFRQAMLSILVHYNMRLRTEYDYNIKKVPSPTIEYETEQFRNRQDTINRFISQMILKSSQLQEYTMSYVAGKYLDWYRENIDRKHNISDISAVKLSLENSRLSQFIVYKSEGNSFLTGHRVKEQLSDVLLEGETSLQLALDNNNNMEFKL